MDQNPNGIYAYLSAPWFAWEVLKFIQKQKKLFSQRRATIFMICHMPFIGKGAFFYLTLKIARKLIYDLTKSIMAIMAAQNITVLFAVVERTEG